MLTPHKMKLIIKRTKYNYDRNRLRVKLFFRETKNSCKALSFNKLGARPPRTQVPGPQQVSSLTIPTLFVHHNTHAHLNH